MLVNSIFYENTFLCLGQSTTLDMSSCPHLRSINDKQLIALIQMIVEITEASKSGGKQQQKQQLLVGHPQKRKKHACTNNARCCQYTLRVTHMDLSRCRNLRGDAVYYCLKHTPHIQRLLLSGATRFDATEMFQRQFSPTPDTTTPTAVEGLALDKLEYIDMSGCIKLGHVALEHLQLAIAPRNLRHINLSGVKSGITDRMFVALVRCNNQIESLNVAGAKKITAYGVGLISYICRDTLKHLNLHGCERVFLPELLIAVGVDLVHSILPLIRNYFNNHSDSVLPPNFVGNSNAVRPSPSYHHALIDSLSEMVMVGNPAINYHRSQQHFTKYKTLEQQWTPGGGRNESEAITIFGQLESLDIGLVGNKRTRIEGCITTIAWLSGGRLRHVNLCGLENIADADLLVLSSLSQNRLQSMNASSIKIKPTSDGHSFLPRLVRFDVLSELDFSCCDVFDASTGIKFPKHLRILKLDYSNIHGPALQSVLEQSSRLLRLSVRGCTNLASSHLRFENNPSSGMLEIDCRDIRMDTSLSDLRDAYPSLLRLNDRCTTIGARMLRSHRSSFLSRVGSRHCVDNQTKSGKRSRGDGNSSSSNDNEIKHDGRNCPSSVNGWCTILRTGFSSATDTEQEMYACNTCSISFGRFVCLNCVKSCHGGHDVYCVGTGRGYCDCCMFFSCQCIDRVGQTRDSRCDVALT